LTSFFTIKRINYIKINFFVSNDLYRFLKCFLSFLHSKSSYLFWILILLKLYTVDNRSIDSSFSTWRWWHWCQGSHYLQTAVLWMCQRPDSQNSWWLSWHLHGLSVVLPPMSTGGGDHLTLVWNTDTQLIITFQLGYQISFTLAQIHLCKKVMTKSLAICHSIITLSTFIKWAGLLLIGSFNYVTLVLHIPVCKAFSLFPGSNELDNGKKLLVAIILLLLLQDKPKKRIEYIATGSNRHRHLTNAVRTLLL